MKSSHLWMIIGCLVPLILILTISSFGLKSDMTYYVLIGALIAGHLLICGRHMGHHFQRGDKKEDGR